MQLNLPILGQLANSHNILIAGAGGGFDVFGGLPLYFALRELGKAVHLANFTFCDFNLVRLIAKPVELVPDLVVGAQGVVEIPFSYYPEGYLAQWFREMRSEEVTVWMLAKAGVAPLTEAYARLTAHLGIDAIIL